MTPGRSRKKRVTEAAEENPVSQELQEKIELVMGQVMSGMQQLQNRMIDLEQKQPGKPDEAMRNPDETMPKEATPSQESFKLVYPFPADKLAEEGTKE